VASLVLRARRERRRGNESEHRDKAKEAVWRSAKRKRRQTSDGDSPALLQHSKQAKKQVAGRTTLAAAKQVRSHWRKKRERETRARRCECRH